MAISGAIAIQETRRRTHVTTTQPKANNPTRPASLHTLKTIVCGYWKISMNVFSWYGLNTIGYPPNPAPNTGRSFNMFQVSVHVHVRTLPDHPENVACSINAPRNGATAIT